MKTTPRIHSGSAEAQSFDDTHNEAIAGTDEEPSSFSRVPLANSPDESVMEGSSSQAGSRKRKKGGRGGDEHEALDSSEITRANLAAANIVGVVGYGPGTGGGSGIRRHTPSCDFCKRRKERCIGGPPCQSCSKRQIECTFHTVNKAHFSRKKTKSEAPVPQNQQPNDMPVIGQPLTMPQVMGAEPQPALDDSEYQPTLAVMDGDKPIRVFKKRGKVSDVACIFCRDRRKKCSAERPTCSNCFKRGVECVYPEVARQRRGGRRRKDADDEGDGDDDSGAMEATQQHQPQTLLPSIYRGEPPTYHSTACHFCKEQDLPCDRTLPGCINCGRRSQPCYYDTLEDGSHPAGLPGVTVWPPPPPHAGVQRWPTPGHPMKPNDPMPNVPGMPLPTAFPFYDVQWMAQWAESQAQQGNPAQAAMTAMYPLPGVPMAMVESAESGGPGKVGQDAQSAPFMFAPGSIYDPAATAAAFAHAAHAAQMQAHVQAHAQAYVHAHAAAAAVNNGQNLAQTSEGLPSERTIPAEADVGMSLSEVAEEHLQSGEITHGEDADGEDDGEGGDGMVHEHVNS